MSQMQVKLLTDQLAENSSKLRALPPNGSALKGPPSPPTGGAGPGAMRLPPEVHLPERWKVEPRGEELLLSLSSDGVLFASGSGVLEASGRKALDDLQEVLSDPELHVRVEGHTDSQPLRGSQYADNWELSVARASAVARYLMKAYGITPSRLAVMGYGSQQPVATNLTPDGRALNRRVVLVVRHSLAPTP